MNTGITVTARASKNSRWMAPTAAFSTVGRTRMKKASPSPVTSPRGWMPASDSAARMRPAAEAREDTASPTRQTTDSPLSACVRLVTPIHSPSLTAGRPETSVPGWRGSKVLRMLKAMPAAIAGPTVGA